jgi:hypothetical protein
MECPAVSADHTKDRSRDQETTEGDERKAAE